MNTRRLTWPCLIILLASGCASLDGTGSRPQVPEPPVASSPEEDPPGTMAPDIPVDTPRDEVARLPVAALPIDTWDHIRGGFRLPGKHRAQVERHIRRYGKNPRAIERSLERGEPYLAYIYNEVEQRGFPA